MAWSRSTGPKGGPSTDRRGKEAWRPGHPEEVARVGGVGARAGHHKQPSLVLENTKKAAGLETWDPASYSLSLDHPKISGKKESRQTHPPRFHD